MEARRVELDTDDRRSWWLEIFARKPREPTQAHLLIQFGRYIAGIAILLVALALFELRLVLAASLRVRSRAICR
jgi:hypothetical protein